jgi:hypothetical protein
MLWYSHDPSDTTADMDDSKSTKNYCPELHASSSDTASLRLNSLEFGKGSSKDNLEGENKTGPIASDLLNGRLTAANLRVSSGERNHYVGTVSNDWPHNIETKSKSAVSRIKAQYGSRTARVEAT